MPVEQSEIDQLQQLAANARDSDELLPLVTIPEVLGFVVETARAEGRDERDDVERVVRGAALDRKKVRETERVLRSLGYVAVADMLKALKLPRRQPNRKTGRRPSNSQA